MPSDKTSTKGLLAHFFYHPVEKKAQSRKEGRPIFEDREYINILIIGQPQSQVARPATQKDKERFAREYEAFRNGNAKPHEGTPLENLSGMTPSRVQEYKRSEIHTVEQLAQINDTAVANLSPQTREFRQKAQRFIEDRKGGVVNEELRRANEEMSDRIAELEAKLNDLADNQPKRRGRGRPPKAKLDSGEHPAGRETVSAAGESVGVHAAQAD